MKLAILGHGIEGKSVEKYFKTHPYDNVSPKDIDITVFSDFKDEEIDKLGLEKFDVVFRSPSVRPHYNYTEHDLEENKLESSYLKNKPYWTSATKYFFSHCPAEIISVTGTKGKGTTCSMTTALIKAINEQLYQPEDRPNTFLVGNIGIPPLDVLDQITEHDNVIYEMSSFQLWDLHDSSMVSVILRIEPDHLNIHKDFEEYSYAKAALSRYKSPDEFLIYYRDNPVTAKIAEESPAKKLSYPITERSNKISSKAASQLKNLLDHLSVPGKHNRENAEAALLAVAARFFNGDLELMLSSEIYPALEKGLANYQGLPHRCQFLREFNNVKYYDDNYSTAFPALDVALNAFPGSKIVLIAGGQTKGADDVIKKRIFSTPNLEKAILIGSTKEYLAEGEDPARYELADTLDGAFSRARTAAEKIATKEKPSIVLMSPGFASFDMFESYGQRGELFTKLVKNLK